MPQRSLIIALPLVVYAALAGCVEPLSAAAVEGAPGVAEEALFVEGLVVPMVGACPAPGVTCVGATAFYDDNDRTHVASIAAQSLHFNVTWEPESPWTEELFVSVMRPAGDDVEVVMTLQGRSPLQGDLDIALAPGDELEFWARAVLRPSDAPPAVLVNTIQPYEIEGVLRGAPAVGSG